MDRIQIKDFLKKNGFKFYSEENWQDNHYAENDIYYMRGSLCANICHPQIWFWGRDNNVIFSSNYFADEKEFVNNFNLNFK